jgi:hypothetical protein
MSRQAPRALEPVQAREAPDSAGQLAAAAPVGPDRAGAALAESGRAAEGRESQVQAPESEVVAAGTRRAANRNPSPAHSSSPQLSASLLLSVVG